MVRNLKSLKQLKLRWNHVGFIDARWANNEAPMQLKIPQKRNIPGTAIHNLDGIAMNIYE